MRQKIPFILFLLGAVFSYGQVTLAISEVKEQRVNQRFSLTVLLEISGENMEQETPLYMPDLSKFDIIGSASERNTVVLDARRGDVLNQLVFQYVLSPKQAGKIKVGSVLVTVNGKIYKTEPFDIVVRDEKTGSIADNSERNDLYLNLELEQREVYKNQPAIAVLRAYSRNYNNFRKVGRIQPATQRDLKIQTLSTDKSEIESRGGVRSQIIGMYMIFPSETGTVEVPAFSAALEQAGTSVPLASAPVRLHVKKLPAGMPQNYKNAVGKFTVDLQSKDAKKAVEVDKPVKVTMKIAGTGNLETLHLPQVIDSEAYSSYAPKITKHTKPQRDGLSGFVSAEYVIVPKRAGHVALTFDHFSFFDPATKTYTDLGAPQLELDVRTPAQIADAKSTIEKVNEYTNNVLETVNTPVLQTQHFKIKDKDRINWKIVFGNLALLSSFVMLILFVRRQKARRKINLQPIAPIAPVLTTIAETEQQLRAQLVDHFQDNIEYLAKLKETQDFPVFFSTYEELHHHALRHVNAQNETDFRHILENLHGRQFGEQYRKLAEHIQIEKFSPVHTGNDMDDLYAQIVTVYTEISKR